MGLGLGFGPQSPCVWLGAGRPVAPASPLSRQSCYEHIQKEDMRLRHLPGHWDCRELW